MFVSNFQSLYRSFCSQTALVVSQQHEQSDESSPQRRGQAQLSAEASPDGSLLPPALLPHTSLCCPAAATAEDNRDHFLSLWAQCLTQNHSMAHSSTISDLQQVPGGTWGSRNSDTSAIAFCCSTPHLSWRSSVKCPKQPKTVNLILSDTQISAVSGNIKRNKTTAPEIKAGKVIFKRCQS